MNNGISSIDYLDKKLAEIFHPVFPEDEYVESLHNKLKHRETVQIDKPYYYSIFKMVLFLGIGFILLVIMRKIYKILSR